jgi:hypothetical protein
MKYKHDCDKCIFLGNYETIDLEMDLYFCTGTSNTFIARYGEDEKYSSCLSPENFYWIDMQHFAKFCKTHLWHCKALLISYERGLYILNEENRKYIEYVCKMGI